jgi:hypothetical protein
MSPALERRLRRMEERLDPPSHTPGAIFIGRSEDEIERQRQQFVQRHGAAPKHALIIIRGTRSRMEFGNNGEN